MIMIFLLKYICKKILIVHVNDFSMLLLYNYWLINISNINDEDNKMLIITHNFGLEL